MRTYRGPEGDERIWFESAEIELIMEDELRKAGLMSTVDDSVVDVEAFLEIHLKVTLDQYADLDPDVLGLTEFRPAKRPNVRINKDLTASAMDSEWCPPGIEGRWRATLAHESSHVVLHRLLFEGDPAQMELFDMPNRSGSMLFRCLKRDVAYRGRATDWREVQANRGMAALLMPKSLFVKVARHEVVDTRPAELEAATRRLATRFAVSREAADIRLQTFGFVSDREGMLEL
jgi:IrrE N-terminal-like domain